MAGGVGYAEGYLGALSQISGIQAQQEQTKQRGLQNQQLQTEMKENAQEKGILADVFRNRADQQQALDAAGAEDKLAQQYRQAGKAMMGVNPREGIKFLQEGDRLMHQNASNRLELAKTEKLKGEYLASVASGVQDQDSLSEYVKRAAKEGQTVPQKYQVWNEATKKYLERAVQASMPISKQQDLMLRAQKLTLDGIAEERKSVEEDRKIRLDASRESRLREGLEIKKAAAGSKATVELGLKGEKAVEGEVQILRDLDSKGVIKNAPPGVLRQAAQDVHYRAQKIRADSLVGGEEPVSAEEALQLARDQVIGEFVAKPGGWFQKDKAERVKGGVEPKVAASPVETAVKAAGIPYEPEVYEYKVEGGKVLRRKK